MNSNSRELGRLLSAAAQHNRKNLHTAVPANNQHTRSQRVKHDKTPIRL